MSPTVDSSLSLHPQESRHTRRAAFTLRNRQINNNSLSVVETGRSCSCVPAMCFGTGSTIQLKLFMAQSYTEHSSTTLRYRIHYTA
ncbi:hypothetical protein RRG08_011572 [Elysia crispata]|uniref:Uncharacterized protein n=1 Tax=Elysia crispata TaxID=231223 RepID=A0AAE1CK44_9GAST|nr:hypothetical protein RRG08_011572 [Elysia crispata]